MLPQICFGKLDIIWCNLVDYGHEIASFRRGGGMFSGRRRGVTSPEEGGESYAPPPLGHTHYPCHQSFSSIQFILQPETYSVHKSYHSINWANQTDIIPYMSASSLKITPFRAISNTLLHTFLVYLLLFRRARRDNTCCFWCVMF